MRRERKSGYRPITMAVVSAAAATALAIAGATAAAPPPQDGGGAPPDFSLPGLKGGTVSLKDFSDKVVLLVFSTTWCPHCRTEVAELKKLHDRYAGRGLVILNIDVQESQRKVASFAENYGIPYTILLDTDGKVTKEYGVWGVPYRMLIDRKGKVVCRPCRNLEPEIEKLFSEGK